MGKEGVRWGVTDYALVECCANILYTYFLDSWDHCKLP
jgi:hypothetical protein